MKPPAEYLSVLKARDFGTSVTYHLARTGQPAGSVYQKYGAWFVTLPSPFPQEDERNFLSALPVPSKYSGFLTLNNLVKQIHGLD
jgi:hypothetical protein